MTANEMIPAVGRRVVVRFEDIEVVCVVRDVKTAWNRPRIQIEPVTGSGLQWVELQRVRLEPIVTRGEYEATHAPFARPMLGS